LAPSSTGFRHFALQLDAEQAVVEAGARHRHIIGEVEATLERTVGDATMHELALFALDLGLLAGDDQLVGLRRHVDLVGREAGDGDRDAIGVFTATLDVVRRVIVDGDIARGRFEQVEQAVEPDGAAAIGGEIEIGTHGQSFQSN
jgi:hypothetical protein